MKLSGEPIRVLRTLRPCFSVSAGSLCRAYRARAHAVAGRTSPVGFQHGLALLSPPGIEAHAPHPPSANSIANGRAPRPRSHPRAPPRAARSPDRPPARMCTSHEATACDRQCEARSRQDASHARPPPQAPLYARLPPADAPLHVGSSTPASQAIHAPRTTPTEPPTGDAPEGTAHDEARPQRPKDEGHTEPDPIRRPGTPPASQPRNARSGMHDCDAPSLPEDAAQEGRKPDALPARPQKTLPTATPRNPGKPKEHGPSHGPGSPSGTASGPCDPTDPPASDPSGHGGSACDAHSQASSARRSKEACRYCRCSDRGGAPVLLSAPEATRSLTQDARSSVRNSRTRPPAMDQTARNDSSKG